MVLQSRRLVAGLILATCVTTTLSAAAEPAKKPTVAKGPAAKPPTRAPVPEKAELDTARPSVEAAIRNDLGEAKTADQKRALADKLLTLSTDRSSSPADRYLLSQKALELATISGDAELVVKISRSMAKQFDREAVEIAAEPLDKITKTVRTGPAAKSAANTIYQCLDEAIEQRHYNTALAINGTWLAAVRKTQDPALLKGAIERNKAIAALKPAWDGLTSSLVTLAETPNDPQASATLGRFLCVVEGEWHAGLPLLKQSKDTALAELATRSELALTDRSLQSVVADAWWDLAQQAKGTERLELQAAAYYWYLKTWISSTGPDRTKAELRLKPLGGPSRPLSLYQARREYRAAQTVLNAGGKVNALQPGGSQPVSFDNAKSVPPTDFIVVEINIDDLSDEDLKVLRGLRGIQKLSLSKTGMSNPGIEHIADLTTLNHLSLGAHQITDDCIDQLCHLVNLQQLNLGDCIKLKDTSISSICSSLKQLVELEMPKNVSDATIPLLKNLPNLRSLDMKFGQATDVGFRKLAELKNIEELDLYEVKLSNAAAAELAGLKQLKKLNVGATGLTDQTIMSVAELKNLESLNLIRLTISKNTKQKLRKALPKCNITPL